MSVPSEMYQFMEKLRRRPADISSGVLASASMGCEARGHVCPRFDRLRNHENTIRCDKYPGDILPFCGSIRVPCLKLGQRTDRSKPTAILTQEINASDNTKKQWKGAVPKYEVDFLANKFAGKRAGSTRSYGVNFERVEAKRSNKNVSEKDCGTAWPVAIYIAHFGKDGHEGDPDCRSKVIEVEDDDGPLIEAVMLSSRFGSEPGCIEQFRRWDSGVEQRSELGTAEQGFTNNALNRLFDRGRDRMAAVDLELGDAETVLTATQRPSHKVKTVALSPEEITGDVSSSSDPEANVCYFSGGVKRKKCKQRQQDATSGRNNIRGATDITGTIGSLADKKSRTSASSSQNEKLARQLEEVDGASTR